MSEFDPQTQLSLKLFISLSRSYRYVSEHTKRDIESKGLNPTEFAVLELLYHTGDQPVQRIAERILLASGSVTYVLDKLENKGYLRRKQSAEDKRVILVSLTDLGTELLSRIFPSHVDVIDHALSGLNDEEKQILHLLLKKLGKSAQNQL